MPEENGKKFFLRKSGRITGPFAPMVLNAMYREGTLACEDMFSEDKRQWRYINELYPDLSPGQPIVITPMQPQGSAGDSAPSTGPGDVSAAVDPAAAPDEPPREPPPRTDAPSPPQKRHPFPTFVVAVGQTFSLLWNFQEMIRDHAEKSGRLYAISAVIHALLSVVLVLLFGKYYSKRFDYLLSPLMGISLLALLFGIASLTGRIAARCRTPRGQKTSPVWKLSAAGIFMNYGTLACCVLALFHGLQRLSWVWGLMAFVYSLVLCSTAMQLRDFLTEEGRSWRWFVICHALIVCPIVAAVICFFATVI